MIGWCGGPDAMLGLRVYADADFAGCVRAMRSTIGVALAMEGPNTYGRQWCFQATNSSVA
jgi:hypothetical protein